MAVSRFECPRCQTVFVKDVAGDAAFVECPSCGALALPAGDATGGELERALSGPQPLPAFSSPPPMASTEAEQGAMPSDPSAPAPGMFSALLNEEKPPAEEEAPRPVVSGSKRAPELDFNFGGLDIDLPSLPPARSQDAPPVDDDDAPPPRVPSRESRPAVHALAPDQMAQLAADAEAGPTDNAKPAPWSALSEDAFGDLEKAFDEMALKPVPPSGAGGRGLTTDEERFLRGDEEESRAPPLRRVEGSERTDRNERGGPPSRPPPRKASREKRPRPQHFELSAEAKKLAFISLDAENHSTSSARPRASMEKVERPRPAPAPVQRQVAMATSQDNIEETDVVRGEAKKPQRKPVPSPLSGLTFLRAMALVVGCAVLGGVGGGFLAPKQKAASTPRARAELRFADGNKFYDAGRYDDALGAFRGALSLDPTFALAHRAKGAALAKLSRFDEAAEAYDEYLKLETSAVDATDVKNAIVRRRGADKP